MTSIASATTHFSPYADAKPAPRVDGKTPTRVDETPARASRGNFWRTILNSIWASRQRQADLEIARYLALNGGHLTDSVEREIGRRMAGQDNYRPF